MSKQLLHALLLLFLSTATTYTAEGSSSNTLRKALSCFGFKKKSPPRSELERDEPIQDLPSNDRDVRFAEDPNSYKYPKKITDRLAMIKAAQEAGFFTESDSVDLSHTPDLTKQTFDTLTQIMTNRHKLDAMPDSELLHWIERADSLLTEDDEAITNLVSDFLRRLRSLYPAGTHDNLGSGKLLHSASNKQAEAITRHVITLARQDPRHVRLGRKIDNITYDHEKNDEYGGPTINCNMENWPIPNYPQGRPNYRQFPLSLKHLVDAGELDTTTTDLTYHDGYIASLDGLELFPNITTLNLADNPIQALPKDPFAHNKKLEVIVFSGHSFQYTPTLDLAIFKGLALKKLVIIDTEITNVKRANGSLQTGTFTSLEPELPNCQVYIAGLLLGSPFTVTVHDD